MLEALTTLAEDSSWITTATWRFTTVCNSSPRRAQRVLLSNKEGSLRFNAAMLFTLSSSPGSAGPAWTPLEQQE